jgi:hypothetical protein
MELLDRLGGRGRGMGHAGNGEVFDSVDVVGVDAGHLEVVVDDEGSGGGGHRLTATGRRGRVTRSTAPEPSAIVMSPPSRSAIWRTNAKPRPRGRPPGAAFVDQPSAKMKSRAPGGMPGPVPATSTKLYWVSWRNRTVTAASGLLALPPPM